MGRAGGRGDPRARSGGAHRPVRAAGAVAALRPELAVGAGRYDRTVEATPDGPLRVHLSDIGNRLEQGVDEVWQVACRGDDMDRGLKTGGRARRAGRARPARQGADRLAPHGQPRGGGGPLATAHAAKAVSTNTHDRGPQHPPRRAGPPPRRRGLLGGHRGSPGWVTERRQPGQRDGVTPPAKEDRTSGRRARSDGRPAPGVAEPVTDGGRGERPATPPRCQRVSGHAGHPAAAGHRPAAGHRLRDRHRPEHAGRRLRRGQQLPNSIYELLIGGVLSATLVPLFTAQLEDDDEEATSTVITVSVIAMATLTAAAIVAAPFIFRLFSLSPVGLGRRRASRRVGTSLARIFLIQIFFYGLMALGSSLLQARRRFSPRRGPRCWPTSSWSSPPPRPVPSVLPAATRHSAWPTTCRLPPAPQPGRERPASP